MTGPEHYREAERLLDAGEKFSGETGADAVSLGATLSAAQVHATLALAAATALTDFDEDAREQFMHEHDAWHRAAGTS